MNEYFDFVLIKHDGCDKNYLFRAPAFSHLKKGDMVTVDTKNGEKMVTVVSSVCVKKTDMETIDFIMNATGAGDDVRKVVSKIQFDDFEYEEDDHE